MTAGKILDLSHPIEPGMVTYPGLPGPAVSEFLSREASVARYAPGTTFSIGRVDLVANTGTYVDAPFHRFEGGADIAGLRLERLADLPGVVLAKGQGRSFDALLFGKVDLRGKAVLLRSGWDANWRTPAYGEGNPFVTRAAAELLASSSAALVGIDSLNIDDTADLERPAHTSLLAAGIPIVEHLCNLAALPASGFRFFAVPAPFARMGSFPVRAFAILDS
ncbi:MAG TPA: cyclase family protein [Thermoanaerobaculia bacterium]|nr:cyclase family protein [Thermoanaerobaculia bacterium]